MADDLATIGYRADLTGINQINRGLTSVGKTGEKTERMMSKSSKGISSGLKLAGGAIAALLTAIEATQKITSVTREFDVLNAQLITATGSAENAAKAFGVLQEFGATTPYSLQQSVEGFTKLVNLGLTPSEEALKSYGNTASAMGKDLSQMIEAVADATTGEFERLKEFGIKAKSEGDNISLTFQGVTKTIGKNAAEIEQYLMRIGQNQFAGAMEQRAKTLDGAISNLGDSWDNLFLTISKQGVGDLIQTQVITAANAIQSLDEYIASGALVNSFKAMTGRFGGFADDFKTTFEIITETIDFESSWWFESVKTFLKNMVNGIKQLPEMTRFYMQLVGVRIGQLVDYAKLYGSAFVDLMTAEFDLLVKNAGIKGEQIANAMNPFSDDVNFEAQFQSARAEYDKVYKVIESDLKAGSDRISAIGAEMVMELAHEAVKTRDIYDARIKKSAEMVEQYKLEKKSARDAVDLAKFKLAGDSTSDAAGQLNKMSKINPFETMTSGAIEAMGAMSMMFESGSKDAQRLAIVMQGLNVVQAVGAVLNQGKGDPYSAFGRMAAMSTAVTALGVSLNTAFSSELVDRSVDIQSEQGLNQWNEKAVSISNSLSMIEKTNSDLVGINSGMLSALQNLQTSLTGAAGLVARDVKTPSLNMSGQMYNLTALDWIFGGLIGGVTGFVSKALGGKQKVVDEGVRIIGGQLNDVLGDITAESYQTVDYKKWRYGSTKSKTAFKAVDEAINQQFELVFSSLADAVQTGAADLGLDQKQVAQSIGSFVMDTISVSLKGMTVDQQIEAFNNMFSQVFNDLASDVVPWLSDLQMAGEDLGETLSRVSTQVSIADLMVQRFGTTFGNKMADPEAYTRAANNVSMLVGGVESLSSLTSSFIDNFATDEQKLAIHFDSLTESLGGVGLLLPETASGMYDLIGSLDGSTEAGQEQIATLLKLGDTASEYYDMLGQQNEAMIDLSNSFADAVNNIYDVSDGVNQIGLDAALASARMGDFSLAEGLNLSDYNLSAGDFSSAAAFNIAQAEAANKLLELSRLSASAAGDVQAQQLDVLNSINSNIIASMQATTELLRVQNQYQAESADYLDRMNTNGVRIEQ